MGSFVLYDKVFRNCLRLVPFRCLEYFRKFSSSWGVDACRGLRRLPWCGGDIRWACFRSPHFWDELHGRISSRLFFFRACGMQRNFLFFGSAPSFGYRLGFPVEKFVVFVAISRFFFFFFDQRHFKTWKDICQNPTDHWYRGWFHCGSFRRDRFLHWRLHRSLFQRKLCVVWLRLWFLNRKTSRFPIFSGKLTYARVRLDNQSFRRNAFSDAS